MEKCHFVGVAPIEPFGLCLAQRACRDDDVDREVHEAALVDDQEVQLEQPGKQSKLKFILHVHTCTCTYMYIVHVHKFITYICGGLLQADVPLLSK